MNCNDIREQLALDSASEDAVLHEHLSQCEACTSYSRQHQTLDVVLRAELRWEAPAALTTHLLALVAAPAEAITPASAPLAQPSARPAPLAYAGPRGWYVA